MAETVMAVAAVGSLAVGSYSAITQQGANKKAQRAQRRSLRQQQAEIDRQKKIEEDQQRRENEQLMNTVSNLTNTSYSGVSSPSVDYDKYGDLG